MADVFTLPTAARDALTLLSGWPRRAAAVVCLLAAAISALGTKRAPAGSAVATVVARHTISAGSVLRAEDLSLIAWPARAAPAGSVRSADSLLGQRAAATLPAGLPITGDSLLEPAIADALAAGRVTTTVRLSDPGQLAILHPGVRVDLYPGPEPDGIVQAGSGAAPAIVRDAEVLSIMPPSEQAGVDAGPAVVIATDRATAAQLAGRLTGPLLATLVPPP